jgi:hypothetical protein
MKKSHIFFGLACLAIILYGIETYNANMVCHEIIPPQGKFDTIFLDKCRGQTFLPVKVAVDLNDDGKTDEYSYVWTSMKVYKGPENLMAKKEEK